MIDFTTNAVNLLMGAVRLVSPAVGDAPITEWGMCRASQSGKVYRCDERILPFIDNSIECALGLVPAAEEYPSESLLDSMIKIVISAKDLESDRRAAADYIRAEFGEIVSRLSQTGEWEMILCVQGLILGDQLLNVGNCTFRKFTTVDTDLWGRRLATGKYDPPPGVIVVGDGFYFGRLETMTNQVVAQTRAKAINSDHARHLAIRVVEESLNLLRSLHISGGTFEWTIPRLGIGGNFPQDSGIVFRLDAPDSTQSFFHGSGLSYPQLMDTIPGVAELDRLLRTPFRQRTDLQKRLVVALEWIGQSALSVHNSVRFVCLATALESVLLLASEHQGITNKFMKRGAWIIGTDAAGRVRKAKYLEESYDIRSSCVHGRGENVTDRTLQTFSMTVFAIISKLVVDSRFAGCDCGTDLTTLLDAWDDANPIVV